MTFKECYTVALERVDEDLEGTDEIILDVVKNGINEGYMLVATHLDKTLDEFYADFESVVILPTDCADVTDIEHEVFGRLSRMDYSEEDDRLYMKPLGISGGEIAVTYVKYPKKLEEDTDKLRLRDAYATIPAIYGAYQYQLYKKKYASAQLLLAEFTSHFPQKAQQAIKQ